MCGLWGGISSSLATPEVAFVEGLATLSQFRGTDSTGVVHFFRSKGKNYYKLNKAVIDPAGFVRGKDWEDILEDCPFIIAGHSRDATVGKVTRSNAHPFEKGKIIGMHNGTISELAPKNGETTDSEVLIQMLANYDPGDVGKFIRDLDKLSKNPAYALVWADLRDMTLNFLRNDKRPLSLLEGMGGCVFWSSEQRMLNFMRAGCGNIQSFKDITPLPVGMQLKFKLGDHIGTKKAIPHVAGSEEKTTHFLPYKRDESKPVIDQSACNRFPYADTVSMRVDHEEATNDTSPFRSSSTTHSTSTTTTNPTGIANVDPIIANLRRSIVVEPSPIKIMYEGFLRKPFRTDYIERVLQKGCDACGSVSTLEERTIWYGYDTYLCDCCSIDASVITQYPSCGYEGKLFVEGRKQ